jgi:hypothetical protein
MMHLFRVIYNDEILTKSIVLSAGTRLMRERKAIPHLRTAARDVIVATETHNPALGKYSH